MYFTDIGRPAFQPAELYDGPFDEDRIDRWADGGRDSGWIDWSGFGSRKKPSTSSRPGPEGYEVDANGDYYLIDWEQDDIAPVHPDLSLLPEPSELFPEIDLSKPLPPPQSTPYPDSKLREIITPTLETSDPPAVKQEMGKDAFARTWRAPADWNPPKKSLEKVQWEGFKGGKTRWETKQEMIVREERKQAVRRGFAHAWQAYKTHAWGHDEVKPVSKVPSDPFNNWGASIVDTLDTLLLMGFDDEYTLCRPHVNQLNFQWVGGRDWSQGFVAAGSETSDGDEVPDDYWAIMRDKNVGLGVFETGIRYLGGMIGAYDLSGDELLLERAKELGDILGKAFETESGLPAGRIDPGADTFYRLGQVSLAEIGSMTLEMMRLSQISGDRKYFDLAQRATDYIEEQVLPRASLTPLIPMWFNPNTNGQLNGGYTFGGLADSYYEYLIKAYQLLGGSEAAQQYRRIYQGSIDMAKKVLYTDITIVPNRDLFTIGKWEAGRLIPETEHLSCFAGAMLGLGAKLLLRDDDMKTAEKFTQTCYWLSASTPTGLQPEVVEFYKEGEEHLAFEKVTLEGDIYHPPLKGGLDGESRSLVHQDREGVLRWNNDGTEARNGDTDRDLGRKYMSKLKGIPAGSKKVVTRGINRPETIESIFYMYRLTGDRKWQEKGWKMFVSWMTAAKVPGGISSINDVTKANIVYGDNMESFAFAETFKYHFLLQSEPDVLSLDDYVLNTEAHPLLVNPRKKSGSQKLWKKPAHQELGTRGQGTDAQKWTRQALLDNLQRPVIKPPPRGGGGGMGGGGGRPGEVPAMPPGWKPKPQVVPNH
ncbi:hypothetical protein P7C73_g984, partial [Tremellales sp. Uapishka_1]